MPNIQINHESEFSLLTAYQKSFNLHFGDLRDNEPHISELDPNNVANITAIIVVFSPTGSYRKPWKIITEPLKSAIITTVMIFHS